MIVRIQGGYVRFAPKADERADASLSPLSANSGLMHRTQTRLKSDGISQNDRSGHAPDSASVRRFAYSRAENHPECWQGCCAIEEEW
jgi:hypothetical protein